MKEHEPRGLAYATLPIKSLPKQVQFEGCLLTLPRVRLRFRRRYPQAKGWLRIRLIRGRLITGSIRGKRIRVRLGYKRGWGSEIGLG